jgi:hypothetical protein
MIETTPVKRLFKKKHLGLGNSTKASRRVRPLNRVVTSEPVSTATQKRQERAQELLDSTRDVAASDLEISKKLSTIRFFAAQLVESGGRDVMKARRVTSVATCVPERTVSRWYQSFFSNDKCILRSMRGKSTKMMEILIDGTTRMDARAWVNENSAPKDSARMTVASFHLWLDAYVKEARLKKKTVVAFEASDGEEMTDIDERIEENGEDKDFEISRETARRYLHRIGFKYANLLIVYKLYLRVVIS